MPIRNKYVKNAKISEAKFRERIAEFCCEDSYLSEIIEVDESYFGAKRVKGKRG